MFAAANGNVIHLYSTTTFDNILNLKGHSGKVSATRASAVSMPNAFHCVSYISWIYIRLGVGVVLNAIDDEVGVASHPNFNYIYIY